MDPFSPMFVFPVEYKKFGLPSEAQQPDIDNLVQLASSLIDEYCGRTDGDGNGSLAYSTYKERLTSQSMGRNIYYIPHRPLATVSQSVIDNLSSLNSIGADLSGNSYGVTGSFFYTGCLPSTTVLANGSQSAIISASGRYGYSRRNSSVLEGVGFGAGISPIGAISLSSGPSSWFQLDVTNTDYDVNTGEVWFPDNGLLGLGSTFNEVVVVYNSGFDPRSMPKTIKLATAAATKNLMAKGSGTTGMTSFSSSRSGIAGQFSPGIIDQNIKDLLRSYVTMRMT